MPHILALNNEAELWDLVNDSCYIDYKLIWHSIRPVCIYNLFLDSVRNSNYEQYDKLEENIDIFVKPLTEASWYTVRCVVYLSTGTEIKSANIRYDQESVLIVLFSITHKAFWVPVICIIYLSTESEMKTANIWCEEESVFSKFPYCLHSILWFYDSVSNERNSRLEKMCLVRWTYWHWLLYRSQKNL